MPIKRVFQASDATVFDNPRDARKHQAKVDAECEIRALFAKHGYSGMDAIDAANLVIEHVAEFAPRIERRAQ